MIKAIFFDLDGTLLNSQKEVSEVNVRALEKCAASGLKLFVATGRSIPLEKTIRRPEVVRLFSGGVFYNGAGVSAFGKTEYVYVPKEISLRLSAEAEKLGLTVALQLENGRQAFSNNVSGDLLAAWGFAQAELESFSEKTLAKAVKFLAYYSNYFDAFKKIPREIAARFEELCGSGAKFYFTDQEKLLQITHGSASKYSAIEKIRLAAGWQKNEVAVFGDDLNDTEMISGFENSVAMGNAEGGIKKAAQFVTKTCDEDGVAHALENFLRVV